MKILKKTKKGFTIIELMVVIVIIGIIAVMAIPNYYKSSENAKYESTVSEIVSILKTARNSSITGKFTGSSGSYVMIEGGHGVFIDKTNETFVSFVDEDEDQTYNASNDTITSTFDIPRQIKIKSMSGAKATDYSVSPETNGDITNLVILFKPPQGEVILNENLATKDLTNVSIQLERYDGQKLKKLKINKISGFIETE